MNDEIKKDINQIIEDTISILKKKEYAELKEISNHTTHNASIYGDKDAISIAVIIYSLFKLATKDFYDSKMDDVLITEFSKAKDALEKNNIPGYRMIIKKIFSIMERKDASIKKYLKEIFIQAQTAKGSRMYEHGISLAMAADMLGVSHWDLMSYVGKTGIAEASPMGENYKQRIAVARKIFGG